MLKLTGVTKSFDGVPVLSGIDLSIEDGEIVSILGSSGSGKTTLLNIILGILECDGGTIEYGGEDIAHTPMEERGFNIVFQDYALFPNLNAYQNITYGLKNKPGISSKEEVEDMIDLLGLRDPLEKKIDMMKGGLEKLNASWETTARLMGDSWLKTVVRIITPNAFSTLVEVFSYYFVNAMVTVSAVIFIAGARTMVITAKIKELQHFADYLAAHRRGEVR